MTSSQTASPGVYQPRAVSRLGVWQIGHLRLKVYGITADGQKLTDEIVNKAHGFAQRDLPALVAAEGEDDGLGFVVIHPGELGVSVLLHWWIQGSVLCQHIERTLWGNDKPMDTAARPVIACVWELGLIDAEQRIWRDTMMAPAPDAGAYLKTHASITEV
ncbi:hypothetical protein [Anderseniella sp. Alg231-50]|uniref:hypothetical protein n=1 Tax=Anderseniella sp. Alg231-50 TaxID=1922226 RepID=UPI00307B347F